ncbi:ADP-ribosylglycohydrolase family protein [Saccharopolyspora sp. NPDC002376]
MREDLPTVDRADAIELAEKWLRATGQGLGEPDGVRVDHAKVVRTAEGWQIPWNSVAWLDRGDAGKMIMPPPAFVVTEPEGQLRHANTTPHPGFSSPAHWPGEPKREEIIDSEYRAAELFDLGVPRHAILGWKVTHPDGRVEEQLNPDYMPGPIQLGMPRHRNRLEAMLNHLTLKRMTREKFLSGLLQCEILIPVSDFDAPPDEVLSNLSGTVEVFSSPARIPRSAEWIRTTVPTFIRHSDAAMVINVRGEPKAEVTADELAGLREPALATYPNRPDVPVYPAKAGYESEPGLDRETAGRLQQQFELEEPPYFSSDWFEQARASGYNLTREEQERRLLGSAWLRRNRAWRGAAWSGDDDISHQSWPTDLHANGLMAFHDNAGRVRPALDTFGKLSRVGWIEPRTSWSALIGAYVGFAVGDALGSALEGMSRPEIEQRYGRRGITGMETAFERPGQVSWRTTMLLFLSEGAVRGMGTSLLAMQPTAMQSAHARWLVAQGVPWQQAAGPLAAAHSQPDGWLVRTPEIRGARGASPQLLAAIQQKIADPGQDCNVQGPVSLIWSLPGGLTSKATAGGINALAKGWNRSEIDVAASAVLSAIFAELFRREAFIFPVRVQLKDRLGGGYLAEPPNQAWEQVSRMLRNVSSRAQKPLNIDADDIAAIDPGDATLTVLGRAVYAAAKREYYPKEALLLAVNNSPKPAITGALTGALVGARAGVAGLPREWVEALDLGDLVQEVADELFWNFGHRNPLGELEKEWAERYPNW